MRNRHDHAAGLVSRRRSDERRLVRGSDEVFIEIADLGDVVGHGHAIKRGTGARAAIGASQAAAEIGTMTVAPAALEGRLPDPVDFANAAIMVVGMKAAGHVAGKIAQIYAKAGVEPEQVVADAKQDPEIAKELKAPGEAIDIPKAYAPLVALENAKQTIIEPKYLTDEQRQAFIDKPFAPYPQQPGEPKIDLYPNVENINSDLDARMAIARATEIAGDKILEATGGHMTAEEMDQAAVDKMMELTGAKDRSLVMPGNNIATQFRVEMTLRGWLLDAAAADFTRKAQAYDPLTSGIEDKAKMLAAGERVVSLSANFQGHTSEWGRAGKAVQLLKSGIRQADAIAKLMEGSPDPAKIAEAMQGVDNPVAAAAVARMSFEPNALTTNQKFLQVRNAALLMGFKVPQVKAIGDGIAWASAIVDRAYAMGIGLFTSGDKVTSNEIMGFIAGSKAGTANALKVAAGIWEGATMPKGGKNPFGYRTVFGEGAQAGEPSQPPAEGTAAARANKVISFPHRVIATETEFLREINKSGESRALAIRQAITEKLQPGTDEFNSRVHENEQNPTPERQAAIDKAGADATFTGELGKYGKALQAFAKTPIGGYIVPFTVVPANLVSWAVRRLPGAAFILDDVRADMAKGGAVRDLAIARQLVGATVATAAYGAVKSGILTGGGMGLNPDQKRAKMDAGWQPYSIKVGDKYYGYNRFEPLARIMSLAADVAEIGDHLAEDDKASLPLMVGAMFGNAVVSQTYLSGLNNFMKALDDPAKMAPMVFDQFVGSWVPAFLAQTAAATDKTTRRVDNAFDAIQNRLPYFRNQMLPQINELTGEPKQNRSSLLPIDMSKISKDPVLSEAARLGVGVAKAPKSIELPAAHQREIGKVELTPEQQNIFSSVAGRIAHQALSNLVDTDRWDALPDISKKRAVEISIALGRKIGKAESLTPEQRETEVERIRDEIMEKLNK